MPTAKVVILVLTDNCLRVFEWSGELPTQFAYPHYYQPTDVSRWAAADLQRRLEDGTRWAEHLRLGIGVPKGPVGKMFGVLVVKTSAGQLGYLSAFSGKMAGQYVQAEFVPPVYNLQNKAGFFLAGEERLADLGTQLKALENAPEWQQAQEHLTATQQRADAALQQLKARQRAAKNVRHAKRAALQQQDPTTAASVLKDLEEESKRDHFEWKDQKRQWQEKLRQAQARVTALRQAIDQLKAARKTHSNQLQKRIFQSYSFLNIKGERQDLLDIFAPTFFQTPPAGAGECAAPKLLQYAFQQGYQPIAMAEFWWGPPPAAAIRQHGQFYPACRGKCEPILQHMLAGMDVAPNPLLRTATSAD
ncbi:MAG: RNA pseudouridine synthase, partial [Bacteroidota bacterium]